MINIVWIGIYQEDIENFNVYGSICKFGINKSKHFVATPGANYYSFIISKVKYFKSLDVDIKYYFYDQYLAYSVAEYINENECICLNSRKNLDWLNNKAITREWIRSQVKTPESIVLSKSEIRLDEIKNLFINKQPSLLPKYNCPFNSSGQIYAILSDKAKRCKENGFFCIYCPYLHLHTQIL